MPTAPSPTRSNLSLDTDTNSPHLDDIDQNLSSELDFLTSHSRSSSDFSQPAKQYTRSSSFLARVKSTLTYILVSKHGHRLLSKPWAIEKLRTYWWFFAWSIFSIIASFFFVRYRRELFEGLENLGVGLRSMGLSGHLLIFFLIFISAFPPMIGYGTYLTLSGFAFGFFQGLLIAYFGALAGGLVCFFVCRRWLKARVKKLMRKWEGLESVVKAVERKGLKLLILIRLAPYPYNIMNILLSASDISFRVFFIATATSLLKIALHIYIGANLTSFAKHFLGETDPNEDTSQDIFRMIAAGVGMALSIGVIVYVYYIAQRTIEEVEREDRIEEGRVRLEDEEEILMGRRESREQQEQDGRELFVLASEEDD